MKIPYSIIMVVLFIVISCKMPHPGHSGHKKVKVHEYVTRSSDDDFIMYYYIMNSTNGGCFYYQSPTQVTDFSKVTFTQSSSLPPGINNTREEIVEEKEVPEELEQNNELTEKTGETKTATETANESDESSTETSTESSGSSSDAGSSDCGGGGE